MKKIQFFHIDKQAGFLADPPVPSKTAMPKWYMALEKFVNNNNKLKIAPNGNANSGVKACVSFLDALTTGYVVKLHCDIHVEREGDQFFMTWTSNERPLSPRGPELADQLPVMPGFSGFTQAWELKYGFIVPKGYSVLVTQPFNRFDLPTFTTTGIIDADTPLSGGGIPFAVSNDFTGIIPQGTPIAQLFPFKRDNWKSEILPYNDDDKFINMRARNRVYGWYRDTIWKKKIYD